MATEEEDLSELSFEEAVARRRELDHSERPTKVVVAQGGADPALRLALIEAGIITYENLAVAEERLRDAKDKGSPVVAQNPAADQSDGAGAADPGSSGGEAHPAGGGGGP